jgi:hypothetical protein
MNCTTGTDNNSSHQIAKGVNECPALMDLLAREHAGP